MEKLKVRSYQDFKQQFDEEIKKSAEGFVRIGYLLKVARDTDVLAEGGYKSVADFAEKEYGLRPDVVSRFIAINDRFAKDGYSDELEDRYQGRGYAKLSEMLTLPEQVADALPEDMTRKEIQNVKDEYRAEKKISDLEVLMEGTDEGGEIMQIMRGYFHEHPEDFKRIFDTAAEGMFTHKEEIIEALAPAGTVTIITRVKGRGKVMLVIDEKKDTAQLVSMRTDMSEPVDTFDIAAAVMQICKKDGTAAEVWTAMFGEPFLEFAPVQKEEKVKTPKKDDGSYVNEAGDTITPAKYPTGVPEEITGKQIVGNSQKKEKTKEQEYDRQQAKIDKETKEKLRELKEAKEPLPSEMAQIVHELKLAEMYYEDVKTGKKTFELRKNDRGYRVGDALLMSEFTAGEPTGRTIYANIEYMLEDYQGLQEGYAILGIRVTRAD